MSTPSEEEARAELAQRLRKTYLTTPATRGMDFPRWEAVADEAIAALASRVSIPPSEVEPVAWAIRGRATGRIREITDDDEYADECRAFYDVIPLVPAVPVPPTEPAEHGMLPGSHEHGGAQCRCGAPWDRWNDRCTSMPAPTEPETLAPMSPVFEDALTDDEWVERRLAAPTEPEEKK